MTWSPLIRAVTFTRRSRRSHPDELQGQIVVTQVRRHVSAMGLEVQPVHGRHCICQRCEREAGIYR